MKKKKSNFLFTLTDEQEEKLKPLWKKVIAANNMDEKGMILMQPHTDGNVYGGFIPYQYAIKLKKIMEKYKKEVL